MAAVAVVVAALGYAQDDVSGGLAAGELGDGLAEFAVVGDDGDAVGFDAVCAPSAEAAAAVELDGAGFLAGGFGPLTCGFCFGLLACSPVAERGGAADEGDDGDDRG